MLITDVLLRQMSIPFDNCFKFYFPENIFFAGFRGLGDGFKGLMITILIRILVMDFRLGVWNKLLPRLWL